MSTLNRRLLLIIGVVLLVAGAAGLLIATNALAALLGLAGLGWDVPGAASPMLADPELPGAAAPAMVVAGGLAVLLALGWLVGQLPRRVPRTAPFRLHADAADGSTSIAPSVVNRAVERQLATIAGVVGADVAVRGAVQAPYVQIKVSVDERADIAAVVRSINTEVAHDLAASFDSTIERLGVLVDVDKRKHSTPAVTLAPG